MAKKKNPTNSSSATETNTFVKGLTKDIYPGLQPKTMWTHARNAANNSIDGDIGVIGNEPANLECARIPYTVIGTVHKKADTWIIFSTDDVNSEIGSFDDSKCEYKTIVNDKCLNFNRKYLITGATKENFDCTWQVYFDDGTNPSRSLNIDDIPYKQIETSTPGANCVIYQDTTDLDCEKIRLAPLVTTPCVKLSKSNSGGQLRNGTYQAYICYVENEQPASDYIGVSNLQSLFNHQTNGGALELAFSNIDTDYEFFRLVIVASYDGPPISKIMGVYSTETKFLSIDFISPSLPPVENFTSLFMRSPAYERSDSMYVVNQYLIRQGPTEQFKFNYQPLANNIKAHWVVAEYDSEYYHKGGNKTQFMRDEVYAFFIRWIYNTGERSSSYHIPGRAPKLAGVNEYNQIISETGINAGLQSYQSNNFGVEYNYQVFNTATTTNVGLNIPTDDGGTIISRGEMAYWQSTERYPATQPEIWDTLCGEPIRHHRMPTEETNNNLALSSTNGERIRILGVEFSNIERPKFNDGTYIPNIVGYEILRGSREGNKSILAKGIFRNMREYKVPDGGSLGITKGLYPNYPYNDLRDDVYFHDGTGSVNAGSIALWQVDPQPRTDGCDNFQSSKDNYPPLSGYKRDIFTFHSPELMFTRPFLNASEVRLYGTYSGQSEGYFKESEMHPQNKLLRNMAAIISAIFGVGYSIAQSRGKKKTEVKDATTKIDWFPEIIAPGVSATALAGAAAGVGTSSGVTTANDIAKAALTLTEGLYTPGGLELWQKYFEKESQMALNVFPGYQGGEYTESYENDSDIGALPIALKLISGWAFNKGNVDFGAQEIVDLIYNGSSVRQFAYKHNSHGFFTNHTHGVSGERFRTKMLKSNYIGSSFHTFKPANVNYKINNLFRPDTVVIGTEHPLPDPAIIDNSRYCIGGDASNDFGNTYMPRPQTVQTKSISARYGALKFNFENQYGQLRGINQVKMNNCIYEIDPLKPEAFKYSTTPIFSGDTYIGRYTEKVIMPIFSKFLLGQPDEYPYDYLNSVNLPYPRFWMNTYKYDTTEMTNEIFSFGLASTNAPLPTDLFYLDRGSGTCFSGIFGLGSSGAAGNSLFAMKVGYMYTHVNGILDFFVESDINLAHRDWKDTAATRFYDEYSYSNVDDLFNAEIIQEDNFYDYNYALSANKFITNLTPGGTLLPTWYDPLIAETCFTYYPKRLIYSLPAFAEKKKDYWRLFLIRNYKDFRTKVNVIKPINKTGAIIFFPYESPKLFQGVDTLRTDLQTKITLGDGGLFARDPQNMVNSDVSNEYGSCESQRGVMNTPYGFYFISQAQGKIFHQSGQSLNPISDVGLKWWFNKYLPSSLIKQFPELEYHTLGDNPVVGVGCQVVYDVSDSIVYFCKRDFKLKPAFQNLVTFDKDKGFITTKPRNPGLDNVIADPTLNDITKPDIVEEVQQKFAPAPDVKDPDIINDNYDPDIITDPDIHPISGIEITIGDPYYFDDCSWTVSYDPKAKAWVSFHDWHPELCMASVKHFLTTKTNAAKNPICPPDYTYNSETKLCEKLIDERKPAVVDVDEIPAFVPQKCPTGYTYNEISKGCERVLKTGISCQTLYEVKKARKIVRLW